MAYIDSILPDWDAMTKQQQKASRWAWTNGKLDFMVMGHQEQLWAIICNHVGLKTDFALSTEHANMLKNTSSLKPLVIEVARRFGKSSLDLLAKFALALTNKNHTYYYTAPNEGDADDIFDDVAPPLLSTCPPDLRPKKSGMEYTFRTGSKIKIGGLFHGGEGLRGKAANGFSIDEAGAIPMHSAVSCLTYVVSSILLPQLLTTRGWSMLMTTPPPNLQHDYYNFARSAIEDDRFIRFTIYQNTSLSPDEIEKMKEATYATDPSGGAWDREYLCIARADSKTLIIPEVTQKKIIEQKWERPQYFEHLHKYICIDHGTVDLNAILYGYYDYPNAKLVVEKETVMKNGPTTKQIGDQITADRLEHWPGMKIERAICDSISQQIRIDLNSEFKDIVFVPPQKTILLSDNSGREGMVNKLINAIGNGYIVIDPSCKILLETLKTAQWKISNGKREFARMGDIGHCDFLAALIYLWIGTYTNVDPLVGVNFDGYTQLQLAPFKKNDAKSVMSRVINRSTNRSIFDRKL